MKNRFASIVSLVILALSMITVAYAGYPSVSNVTEKGYVLGQALGAQGNLIVDVSCSSSNFEYKVVIGYDTLSDICAEANGIGITCSLYYNSSQNVYVIRVHDRKLFGLVNTYGCIANANGYVYTAERETSTPAPDITVIVPSVPSVSFDDTNVLNALEDIYDRLTLMIECQIKALHDIILNARFVSNLISLVDDDIYPRLLDILSTNSNTYNLLANFLDSFNSKFSDLDSLFGTDSIIEIQNGDTFTWDSSSQGLVSAVADGNASNIRFTPTTVLSGYNTGWNDDGHFSITPVDGSYFPSVLDVGAGMVTMPTVETSEVETITNPALNPDVPSAYAQYSECYVGTSINTGIVPYTGMYLETSGSFGFGGGASSSPQYLFGTKGLSIDIPAGGQSLRFVSGSSTWNHEKNFAGNGTYTTSFGIRWTFGSSVWVSCGTVRSSDSVTAFPAAPSTLYLSGVNDSDNLLNRKAVTWKRTTIKDSNGNLLYALIPCKRISDGVSGLYRVDYADGVCTGGTFLTGNYCTAYSELPLTVEAPVTQSVNFVRLYRAPSNIWYALATDGTSHAFTLESLVALVKAFPVCEYANVSSVANIPDGSYQVTWNGDAQSITINYQAYSKFFAYISNQLAYNRSWLDERLAQLPAFDDTELLSGLSALGATATRIADAIDYNFGQYSGTHTFPSLDKRQSYVYGDKAELFEDISGQVLYSSSERLSTFSYTRDYDGMTRTLYVRALPTFAQYTLELLSDTRPTAPITISKIAYRTLLGGARYRDSIVYPDAWRYSSVANKYYAVTGFNVYYKDDPEQYPVSTSASAFENPYVYGFDSKPVDVVFLSRFTAFQQLENTRLINALSGRDYTSQLTAVAEKLDALLAKSNETVVNVINDNTYVPDVLYLDDSNSAVDTTKDGVSLFGGLVRWLWKMSLTVPLMLPTSQSWTAFSMILPLLLRRCPMEANLYTFLHFVRSVFTSMPVGLQVCVMYSFSSLLIVTLVLMIARWK